MTTPQLDPVSVAVVLAGALITEPVLAQVIGPYAVIFVGAVLGGGWALSLREAGARLPAVLFLAYSVGLSLLLTVGCSVGLQQLLRLEGTNWLLAPVAVALGRAGPVALDAIGKWLLGRLGRLIDKRLDIPPGGDSAGGGHGQ